MPIPPIVDHYSAQVILKGLSGSPKDVYTNTFYFHNNNFGGTHDTVADQLADDLTEFYNAPPTTVATPVALSSRLSGETLNDTVEIRVYDLGDPAPRYPKIRSRTWTINTTSSLPSEVAACLSLVAGENQPRRRGRLFLGPLAANTIVVTDGRPQIQVNMRESVLASAQRLMEKPSFEWCVYSPTSGQMNVITGAWMDSAFDTMRKRGEAATHRMTTGLYLGQSGTPVPFLG